MTTPSEPSRQVPRPVPVVVRPRSWAPALLVGHVALAVVLVVISLVLLVAGAGERAVGGPLAAVLVGLLVVGAVARRFGTRPQTRGGRWSTVLGLAVVGPWVWYVLGVAGLSGYTGPLLGVLALYLWVYVLALVVAAVLVAFLDLAAGEVLRRRRG
ncbi:hypothetical protein [Klenkia terrae]|uniref:Transmembrane protein n=1 Tax=Klenkia terrae TaxID=1052259 RepID=A0ABU8E0L5_9ACTN|nr:hypothetical protein [Klenkia terrae]